MQFQLPLKEFQGIAPTPPPQSAYNNNNNNNNNNKCTKAHELL